MKTDVADPDLQLAINAEQLEQALGRSLRALPALDDDEEREWRASAIEQIARYVDLLRATRPPAAPPAPPRTAFAFKLQFPDGRWDVAEKELAAAPRLGDVVSFEERGRWRVRACELVRPRPPRKPPREFFVCAPAA